MTSVLSRQDSTRSFSNFVDLFRSRSSHDLILYLFRSVSRQDHFNKFIKVGRVVKIS